MHPRLSFSFVARLLVAAALVAGALVGTSAWAPAASAAPAFGPHTITDEGLAALRACESGGDYGIVSASGVYHGAYQWNPRYWDEWATDAGYPEWAATVPSQVPPEVQDAVTVLAWSHLGGRPWPHCQYRARAAMAGAGGGAMASVDFGGSQRVAPAATGVPVGSLDKVAFTEGHAAVHVGGWAYDPDALGCGSVCPGEDVQIHVYAGSAANGAVAGSPGARLVGAVRTETHRPDVAAVHGIGDTHTGFDFVIPVGTRDALGAPVDRVCVHVRGVDGAGALDNNSLLLGCSGITAPR